MLDKLHTYIYDFIVRNKLFNKTIWGNDPVNYTDFVLDALKQAPAGGKIADIACGALTFYANIYAQQKDFDIFLIDSSQAALNLAIKRLQKHGAGKNIKAVKANAFNLPFDNAYFDLVINFGFLHLFSGQQISKLLDEFYRVMKPGAKAYFLILVNDRKAGRWVQHFLHLIGQIGKPRPAAFYLDVFRNSSLKIINHKTIGSMQYIIAGKG